VKQGRACRPRGREVFVLCRFEELSHAEIARRLGISRNTAVSHMVAALAALEWEMGERERDSQNKMADVSCWIAFRASRQ
jgi:DNA-directed RNA polymerase specialized sigma24 family protein